MGHPPEEELKFWNQQASTFDEAPDHGLAAPEFRLAWQNLLEACLPDQSQTVLDIGCGTGSISLLVQDMGHKVVGIDFSEEMIRRAATKAQTSGLKVEFLKMDASQLGFRKQSFDVLISRHVLWQFNPPKTILRHWAELLCDDGRLILIEGNWDSGARMTLSKVLSDLPSQLDLIFAESLVGQVDLWGHAVDDERFVVVAAKKPR